MTTRFRRELHRFVDASCLTGVQLHRLLFVLWFHGDVQRGPSLCVRHYREADAVTVVAQATQRVAIVQDARLSLKLQVVLCELQATEAERHSLHHAMRTC